MIVRHQSEFTKFTLLAPRKECLSCNFSFPLPSMIAVVKNVNLWNIVMFRLWDLYIFCLCASSYNVLLDLPISRIFFSWFFTDIFTCVGAMTPSTCLAMDENLWSFLAWRSLNRTFHVLLRLFLAVQWNKLYQEHNDTYVCCVTLPPDIIMAWYHTEWTLNA